MTPEIKDQILSKLTEGYIEILEASKALTTNNLEEYHSRVTAAGSILERLRLWNIKHLRNNSFPKPNDPNVEIDQAREHENLKRNIENKDRLGYEY